MITKNEILSLLPAFRNERVLVKKNQNVSDIIELVLDAHEANAKYYDLFAANFQGKSLKETCDNLYKFLEKNVRYKEETEDEQTTAVPSGILTLGHGDCKHYSSFAGGVLDALNRQGENIDWCYRFCSYRILEETPHHVFIVVHENDGSEIWIDPVPGANKIFPTWQIDKYTNTESMPLYNVVGNVGATVGYTTAEKITHAAAKVAPLMIAARAAFLQMVKWNVKAWAKNMHYLMQTKGTAFTDPLGKKWYLLGGEWQPLVDAIYEGKDKKMIGGVTVGFTGAEIAAMLTAAAPIIIAITSVIKSSIGNDTWEQGQPIPGMTTLPGGGYTTPTTGSRLADLLKNPVVLIGGAAAAYFLLTPPKKVNGAVNNDLLLIGGGLALLFILNKKTATENTVPLIEQPGLPTNSNLPPTSVEALPIDEHGMPIGEDPGYIDPVRLDLNEPAVPMYQGAEYFGGKEYQQF